MKKRLNPAWEGEIETGGASLEDESRELLWELSRRIVRLRRALGWSRDELARRVRVSRERLGHWERGTHSPPLQALVSLGRALGASMDELLTGMTRDDAPFGAVLSRHEREEAARHFRSLNRCLSSLLTEPSDDQDEF